MIEKLKKYLNPQRAASSRGSQSKSGSLMEKLNLKKLIALFTFGAIILVFVFFGMQGQHAITGAGVVARVNSVYLSLRDLQFEIEQLEQAYGRSSSDEQQRQFIRNQALDNLVMRELVSQTASKIGVMIVDTEIRDLITKEIPSFQKNGRFERDIYVNLLASRHLTPGGFESKLRSEKKTSRLRRIFDTATTPSLVEAEALKSLKTHKLNISFAKIDEEAISKSLNVPSTEITRRLADEAFMKKVKDDFEQNKAAYSLDLQKKDSPKDSPKDGGKKKNDKNTPSVKATLENTKVKIAKKLILKEIVSSSMKALEEAVPKKDQSGIESALARLGVKWDETGYFELGTETIPKLNGSSLTQACFEVTSANPLLPRLVREGSASYLVKFKESKEDLDNSSPPLKKYGNLARDIAQARSNDVFYRWTESLKKVGTIEKNQSALKE